MVLVLEYCILDLAVLLRKARHLQGDVGLADTIDLAHSSGQPQQQQEPEHTQQPAQHESSEQHPPGRAGEDVRAFAGHQDQHAYTGADAGLQGADKAGAEAAGLHVLSEAFIKGIVLQVLLGVAACHSAGEWVCSVV